MSDHTTLALMSRMVNLIEKGINLGSGMAFIDTHSFELMLSGVVHPNVMRIERALCSLPQRSRALLAEGDSDEWRKYVQESIELVKRRGLLDGIRKAPVLFQVKVIGDKYNQFNRNRRTIGANRATFQIVQGVSALLLPSSKFARNAVLQVASQFNFLESVTYNYSSVDQYLNDHTQGPQASLGSLAALIVRDHAFKDHDPQDHYFKMITTYCSRKCYVGGYFMPYVASENEQKYMLAMLQRNINSLSVLAQWGLPDVGAYELLQVFTAAPSYQGNASPEPESFGDQICTLLVSEQYAAVAKIAAMRSVVSSERVPLHLTLVGQGAFNNPPSVMKAAFEAVYSTVRFYDVDVYFHGYSEADVGKIRRGLPGHLNDIELMSAETFFKP
jgi:hypothetical protein